jgi:hypothetical protein
MQTRLDLAPDSMRVRRQTVEHPYGTIKLWMGNEGIKTRRHRNEFACVGLQFEAGDKNTGD